MIHWGAGCVREKLDAELGRVGARRVLLVTTRSAAQEKRLAPAIEALLGERFAKRVVIGQHAPVESLVEAVGIAHAASIDALVSLGGGSPIDAAKAIAYSLATGIDLRLPDAQARGKGASLEKLPPHLALPTTLSVAELSGSAGFSAEGTHAKVGVASPALRPAAVFYDAELALMLEAVDGILVVPHGALGQLGAVVPNLIEQIVASLDMHFRN